MKLLIALFAILLSSVGAFAHELLNVGGGSFSQRVEVYCTTENSTSLLMSTRGQVLKAFTFETDCDRAVMSRQSDLVCATDVVGKTALINVVLGLTIKEFTLHDDCMNALTEAPRGLMCAHDVNFISLINKSGEVIQRFSSLLDCEAVRERLVRP